MGERSRWLLLVLSLIVGFGGLTVGGILYTNSVEQRTRQDIERVQDEQQRDLCDFVGAVYPTDPAAPRPSSSVGAAQRAAAETYQHRRCTAPRPSSTR